MVGEVAEVLPPTGLRQTIVVVGGSLLALHGLVRTLDVDMVRAINQAVSYTHLTLPTILRV